MPIQPRREVWPLFETVFQVTKSGCDSSALVDVKKEESEEDLDDGPEEPTREDEDEDLEDELVELRRREIAAGFAAGESFVMSPPSISSSSSRLEIYSAHSSSTCGSASGWRFSRAADSVSKQ